MDYEEITKNIYEHIMKAKKQSLKEKIKANTIAIDTEVAKVNGLYFPVPEDNSIIQVPTMILGLKIMYVDNLSDSLGIPTNFAILEKYEPVVNKLKNFSTEELLDEIKRRIDDNEEE